MCIQKFTQRGNMVQASGLPGGGFKHTHTHTHTPEPRNSEVLQSRTGLQIVRKMFSVPIPTF
jgi:hypothetical protein